MKYTCMEETISNCSTITKLLQLSCDYIKALVVPSLVTKTAATSLTVGTLDLPRWNALLPVNCNWKSGIVWATYFINLNNSVYGICFSSVICDVTINSLQQIALALFFTRCCKAASKSKMKRPPFNGTTSIGCYKLPTMWYTYTCCLKQFGLLPGMSTELVWIQANAIVNLSNIL